MRTVCGHWVATYTHATHKRAQRTKPARPHHPAEACRMLSHMNGRRHVHTKTSQDSLPLSTHVLQDSTKHERVRQLSTATWFSHSMSRRAPHALPAWPPPQASGRRRGIWISQAPSSSPRRRCSTLSSGEGCVNYVNPKALGALSHKMCKSACGIALRTRAPTVTASSGSYMVFETDMTVECFGARLALHMYVSHDVLDSWLQYC